MSLTPDDRRKLDLLADGGIVSTEPHWVTHRLSFSFNGAGASGANAELKRLGWPRVTLDEDPIGEDSWHISAWRTQPLTEECVAAVRAELEAVATRHGGDYDGWELTRDGLGRAPDPGETRFMVRPPRRPRAG
jgi:hypothetical protein